MFTVPQRIARIANSDPSRLAIEDDKREWTFAQLLDEASAWASEIDAAFPPSSVVPVLGHRGAEMVAQQLGSWLSGRPYLPIDPGLPHGRVVQFLQGVGATTVLAAPDLGSSLKAEGILALSARRSRSNLAPRATPLTDSAYLIYTSGSSGLPKATLVGHASLGNLVEWHAKYYGTGLPDRVAAFANLGFDSSVKEIWSTLSAGATLILSDVDLFADIHDIYQVLCDSQVSECFLATTLAEQLWNLPEAPPMLRRVITAGDRLKTWPPKNYSAAVFNEYGPTEATVCTTASGDLRQGTQTGFPPIGWPIHGTVLRIDTEGDPEGSEDAESGELLIGGDNLAFGYFEDEEGTRRAFVEDAADGSRWYRTGDVVHFGADGQLHFLGRKEGFIKLRGYRISLVEIEGAIMRHQSVKDVAVVLAHRGDDEVLIGHVVGEVSEQDLLIFLAAVLPRYMIPNRILLHAELPLTARGKVDRASLQHTEIPRNEGPVPVGEIGELEKSLRDIWFKVIGSRPTESDDFFRLGGTSLDAVRVTSKVRELIYAGATLIMLFQNPVFSDYVATIERAKEQTEFITQ